MTDPREDPHAAPTQATERGDGAPAVGRATVVWEGGAATRALPEAGTLVLGRAVECELAVDHASVSRQHARLHVAGGRVTIEDLGSANGTRVAGQRIGRGERHAIVAGTTVELGKTQLVVTLPSLAAPTPAAGAAEPDLVVGRAMGALYATAARLAEGDLSVLLLGETGVGKDVVAKRLHATSSRRAGPFLAINCAALPEALLESELFGHERGAFTGAAATKVGLLEAAAGGTVLLDEIGELTVPMQSKLLRALEDREVLRVGGLKARPIDVRFLGATSRDLEALVRAGAFRPDLYYRVSGAVVRVPPLRERRDEILPLAERFASAARARAGRTTEARFTPEAARLLEAHAWPGNVRELRNVAERAAITSRESEIPALELAIDPAPPPTASASVGAPSPLAPARKASGPPSDLRAEVDALERARILEALEQFGGNQTRAAKAIGISRRTLLTRLDAYGVPRPRK